MTNEEAALPIFVKLLDDIPEIMHEQRDGGVVELTAESKALVAEAADDALEIASIFVDRAYRRKL